MVTALVVVAVVAVVAGLPYWLPRAVVALRIWIFAAVNGEEGVPVPGPQVGADRFKELYAHPAARGRSRGATLSDLFWYWLAPGPEVHQEHLEPGPRYDDVARTTRRLLARPRTEMAALATAAAGRVLDERPAGTRPARIRDLMMPVWAEVYYEVVFGERCPREARDLIVANADDVITALKFTGRRHMDRRAALTAYLRDRVAAGTAVPLPETLTAEQRLWYLQGTFFNTAVVQMSEAMAHLLMALAEHPDVRRRVRESGDAYLDRVIEESFRRWPLFGIAHRITTEEITVGDATLPAGSVLCFNYPEYHATGFADAERFDPDRWADLAARDVHHIPFGVTANRPCPARAVAPATMRAVTREVLRRYDPYTSAAHIRSLPNRGPVILVPRGAARPRVRLAYLRFRDRWEDVWRSILQLAYGTAMVLHAKHLRLAERHFAEQEQAA